MPQDHGHGPRTPPMQGLARQTVSPEPGDTLGTPSSQGFARALLASSHLDTSRPPPLQGLARLQVSSTADEPTRPSPLQSLARHSTPTSGVTPRTPPLQGSARLIDSVPAALDVPSADRCLQLLLEAQLHTPAPRPNTTFATDVFDPTTSPAHHGSMQERARQWDQLLDLYPDPSYRRQLLGMIKHGCLLGYEGPLRGADRGCPNLPIPPAGHNHLRREIDACLAEGRLTVISPGSNLVESPIGVVPKPRSTKLRTIHHLSHPRRPPATTLPSVNASIQPGFIRIQYEGLESLISFVSTNPGCLLWKGDLEDAFRHVVTSEPDSHLLGFSYEGVRYRENALTFGGSSSPWLFNLVAEFLHWLVAACLPPNWPINHYLDDTFGAVPSSHASLALLPIRMLALASQALGLRLSPKKTFGGQTKLEVLGVEIDTLAQTIGISNERRARILGQCRSLLTRRSADLLDMQRIAGLLQFVSQVFPCGKAFLRRLYDATIRHPPGRRRLSHPVRAELTWWCHILESWPGTRVLSPSPLVAAHIWTDACPRGFGGFLGPAVAPLAAFSKEVPRRHRKKNICFLEALAVLEALRRFSASWSTPTFVVIHVDNENVEHGLRTGRSRDPLTQRLLREIFGLCFTRDITLYPQRVSSTDNVLADLLSRRQFLRIQQLFPMAHSLLFSHPAPVAQPQPHHLHLGTASASPTTQPPSSGTALPPALDSAQLVLPPNSMLSVSVTSALALSASQPPAPSSSNGSATSPPTANPSTQPSTTWGPSAPTTSTWVSTSQVSPVDASNVPSVDISASMASAGRELSFPSPSPSSDGSSRRSRRSLPSRAATDWYSRLPLRLPLPASSVQARSSGTSPPTAPPSSLLALWPGITTTPSSPSQPPKPTPSAKVSAWLPQRSAASNAQSPDSASSPQAGPTTHPSSAWAHLDKNPSPVLPLWGSCVSPCSPSGSQPPPMQGTPSDAALPPGPHATEPQTPTSSPLGDGALTAIGGTSIGLPPNDVLLPPLPSMPSATGPSSLRALPGVIQARIDHSASLWVSQPDRDRSQLRWRLDRRVGGLGASELETPGPETRNPTCYPPIFPADSCTYT